MGHIYSVLHYECTNLWFLSTVYELALFTAESPEFTFHDLIFTFLTPMMTSYYSFDSYFPDLHIGHWYIFF